VTRHRFYSPASLTGAVVELIGSEAHHLHNVLRLREGAEVELFDGLGTEATARVEQATSRRAKLTILSTQLGTAERTSPLILATAIPKGDRFRWLVEKATELGVSRLIPLQTERSIVDPRSAKLNKMRAAIVAATKQCGRSRLMHLDELQKWSDVLQELPNDHALIIGHPGGSRWSENNIASDQSKVVLVGPEGGLTEAEVAEARERGAVPVDLGPRILRIETAALVLLARCTNE